MPMIIFERTDPNPEKNNGVLSRMLEAAFQVCVLISIASLWPELEVYTTLCVSVAPAQWHRQIPQALKLRPGGSRQGLDIFSAFPAPESPMLFSSPTQKLVESEELWKTNTCSSCTCGDTQNCEKLNNNKKKEVQFMMLKVYKQLVCN